MILLYYYMKKAETLLNKLDERYFEEHEHEYEMQIQEEEERRTTKNG